MKTLDQILETLGPLPDAVISDQDPCLAASIDARLVMNTETGTLSLIISDR